MAVPAHDTRDYEFAKKFNLPIVQVVDGENVDLSKEAFTDVATGKLINSDFLNGLEVAEAKKTVIKYLENNHIGTKKLITNYVTGYFLAKDIGVNLFQWFIVKTAVGFQLMKKTYL